MTNEEKILAILEKHGELLTQMQQTQIQMQGEIGRINARLDFDAGKRLDALSEGQGMIEKRLDVIEDKLHDVEELAEETRDKVDVIHAVVAQHSTSITELKKVK